MKSFLLMLSIVLVSFNADAQSLQLEHDHSTIQVRDIDRSVAFYKGVLKLKELETPWPENNMIRFFATGNNQELHIAQVDGYGEIQINKVLHLAFATNNFDQYLGYLDENEVVYTNFDGESKKIQVRPDGVRQIYLQDPDGYWVEINDAKHD